MARNPYQMDPFLAQGFSNLTKALIGDPQTDYQVARTGLAQSQTRGQDLENTMNQNIADALLGIRANPQVQSQIAKAFGFDDQTIGALSPDILGNLATLAYGQGGTTNQTTQGFGNISSSANQQRGFEQMMDPTLPLQDQAAGFSAYSKKAPTGAYNPNSSKTPSTKLTNTELKPIQEFLVGKLEQGDVSLPTNFTQYLLDKVTSEFTNHKNQQTANNQMSELFGDPVKINRGFMNLRKNVDTTTTILSDAAEILDANQKNPQEAANRVKQFLVNDIGYSDEEADLIIASDELEEALDDYEKTKINKGK